MKKLLHITAHLGGGVGKAVSGLIKNLRGYENTVIMLEEPENAKYRDMCISFGCRVITAPGKDEIFRLAEESDAVIFNWWAHPLTVDLIRELGGANTRMAIWTHINGFQYPVLTAEFLCAFDAVMFTTPCSLKNPEFSEKKRSDFEAKCSVVYGMGDFHPERSDCKKSYCTNEKIRIGYIGTLDFAKMNRDFPRICSKIKERVPNAEFTLCGNCTQEFKNAFFCGYPELRKCTEFAGFVSDPEKMLISFDIFCYPLTREHFGTTENAILEAMAAGVPVVVLGNLAEREIVENDVNGICAESIFEFIDETIFLCGNENTRKRLGSAAREHVIRKYSSDANAENFALTVEKMLKLEKRRHNIRDVIGNGIWQNFLYFCGSEKEKIIKIMNGESVLLPDIFYCASKSSPQHYLKYFDDKNFIELAEKMRKPK